jgi:hypothetical protein
MKDFVLLRAHRPAGLGWLLGLLLLLAAGLPARAQFPTSTTDPTLNPALNPANPQMVRPDTATVRKISKKEKRAQHAADSAKRTERLFGLHLTRPEKAGILALIPGTGQIYNHKYWKLPIVYGMVGGLGYWVIFQQRYYSYFVFAKEHYNPNSSSVILNAVDAIPNEDLRTQIAALSYDNIENNLQGYRRYRDLSVLISALGYSLQILDAVVDAHLHDFDVSDNLSLNWEPTMISVPGQVAFTPGLTLTLRAK